jgi:threonyl-tRNA synthetase
MTENYAGDFPFWLAPEQVRLLPVSDGVLPWAQTVLEQLKSAGVRATLDLSGDRLGKLIRNGEQMKIPVLGVIGAKEAEAGAVSLRTRREGDRGVVSLEQLITGACQANGARAASLTLS